MTKVKINIAGGYLRTVVKSTIENNPSLSSLDAVKQWLDQRYGGWIKTNMPTAEFSIEDVTYVEGREQDNRDATGSFNINFTEPVDANYFVKQVGGKIIQDS